MVQGPSSTARQRRRLLLLVTLRVLATAAVVLVLYYTLPMDRLADTPLAVPLVAGLLLLGTWGAWQIRSIMNAQNPTIRATVALSGYLPVFLVLFASGYYLMAQADPANFNVGGLTRTDTLYFTLTVFSTVGFGDINATSQVGRTVVMVQMVLNLILVGAGVRLLTQAVHIGSARREAERTQPGSTAPPGEPDEAPAPRP
ncbi:potassium channel family protein [Cellulomonas sp. P5_C6]